jgi:hypothetical protein
MAPQFAGAASIVKKFVSADSEAGAGDRTKIRQGFDKPESIS